MQFLNAKEVRLEESVPAAMPRDVGGRCRLTKRSECEMKFVGRDRVCFKGSSQYRRVPLLSWSQPGIKRAAGNRIMGRGVFLIRRGRRTFVIAAVHIVLQGR